MLLMEIVSVFEFNHADNNGILGKPSRHIVPPFKQVR